MHMDELLDVKLVTEPDLIGQGRVIYNGRYYGLPVAIIEEYKRLRENAGQATPDK